MQKIINIVLLISFLISGGTGILMVLSASFFNLIQIHNISGVVMVLGSLIHIIWHWPYFKAIFGQKKD